MNSIRKKCRTEAKIQDAIVDKLKVHDWYVRATHGSIYQHGFPDLFCAHRSYGQRWCEVKNPAGYSFTPSQRENFLLMAAAGVGIWIATSPDQVPDLFFRPPNLIFFMEVMKVTNGG
jgi:hypothetical protein